MGLTSDQGCLAFNDTLSVQVIGEYVAIVGPGVVIPKRVLNTLIATFTEFERVGMVGPVLPISDSLMLTLSNPTCRDASGINIHSHEQVEDSHLGHTRQVNYLSLAYVLVAGEVWKKINWFDEIYAIDHYPEITLSHRVREMGYQCLYVPSPEVIVDYKLYSKRVKNQGSASNSAIEYLKLKARWFRPKGKNQLKSTGSLGCVFQDIKRVLFLDLETPQTSTNAGGYAAIK